MKKYLFLIMSVLFAIVAIAQERTVTSTMKTGASFLNWPITAADTLKETNQDTIDYLLTNLNFEGVEKIVYSISLDSLAGNDSVYYSLSGLNDLLGSTTTLTSGGLLINKKAKQADISAWWYTNDTTYIDVSFRFYRLRLIQAANNDYDGGAKVNYLTTKMFFK